MRTLIRNATCVFPDGVRPADVLIDGERIVDVAASRATAADEIVDASGLHLLPGIIDDQVHFRDPGLTHKEDLHTGSLACAKGGVTTFLEMPNTRPATITNEALLAKLERAESKCVVNYGFYVGATPDNVEELRSAERTPGIKIFIGSSTGNLLVDQQEALERIFAETTLPICAHCEDEATVRANAERLGGGHSFADHSRIRDHAAALIATRRAIDLAHRHKHRFHVLHVSTADELAPIHEAIVRNPQNEGRYITAEVCPHHLLFNIEDYERLGSLVQMNPSIKTADDNRGLWRALADNTIQVVATDHAPHTLEEKQQSYPASPSGLPAVENVLALMLNAVNEGRLSLERLVAAMCDAPARVWDIVGKGRIAEGYDADLVLVDLERCHTIRNAEQLTKCGWSPWDGVTLTGLPIRTWVMGETVFAEGKVDAGHRGHEARFDHQRGGFWATVDH
jgi:dihydroorotase